MFGFIKKLFGPKNVDTNEAVGKVEDLVETAQELTEIVQVEKIVAKAPRKPRAKKEAAQTEPKKPRAPRKPRAKKEVAPEAAPKKRGRPKKES